MVNVTNENRVSKLREKFPENKEWNDLMDAVHGHLGKPGNVLFADSMLLKRLESYQEGMKVTDCLGEIAKSFPSKGHLAGSDADWPKVLEKVTLFDATIALKRQDQMARAATTQFDSRPSLDRIAGNAINFVRRYGYYL